MKRVWIGCASAFCAAVVAHAQTPAQQAYRWTLPSGFAAPHVPADNPMSDAKVELGRHLFYDVRLSGNGTQSCASCHQQERAFTDGRGRGVGSTGQVHPRGSMSLVNVAYAEALTWADPTMTRLENQALVPMYGDQPIELGLDRSDAWIDALKRDSIYQRLVANAFPGQPNAFTKDDLVKALATFERAIVSARSPYDRYHFDREDSAIPDAAKRGEILFHSRPFSCFTCHGGVHFSDAMGSAGAEARVAFHDIGLPDGGNFKAPTLRNIAVTAPYMHDGSVTTLDQAVDHGTAPGFAMTPLQRADLVAFMQSLTDEALLRDSRFANPWTGR